MRTMIQAVIFDMDGVIVESEHLHIQAEKQVLLKNGLELSSEDLHKYTGTTAKDMFTDIIRRYKLNTTFEDMNREKKTILLKLLDEETQPTKGVVDLIWKLQRKDIKLGIASSSDKDLIKYILRKLKLSNAFHSMLSSDDIIHGKPDPEIFLKSAQQLNTNPSVCLVVEDSTFGVEAAKKAGMKCLGYRNPQSGNQDLSLADIIIDDFSKVKVQELILL
ncbi:MAG: HAD family phosphatase [Candidatus Bathyarchaeota archaeon]